LGFAMLASGRDVTGSGSCIYDNGYYLIIKSYSSVVVVKFTTKAEFHYSFCRTILLGNSCSSKVPLRDMRFRSCSIGNDVTDYPGPSEPF
jgi:hypothetical protein